MLCLNIEAIKTGRYTHEKRTKDIQEIKSIQQKQVLEKEAKHSIDRGQELEEMVDRIVKVHLQQTPLTEEFYEKLPKRQAKFLVTSLFKNIIIHNACIFISLK